MKKTTMFILAVLMALCGLFAMSKTSFAKDGWSIRLEPMWMGVEGNDVHVGDVYRERTVPPGPVTRTYEPIRLNMMGELTLRVDIQEKKAYWPWGLGVSGWWLNADSSVSGMVRTPVAPPGTRLVNGVRMWDHNMPVVRNDLDLSGLSPVDYWARNDLNVWTMDVFGLRTLAEKKDSHSIDLTVGLKLGGLDSERNEGQRQHAFVLHVFGPGRHLDSRITGESTSKAGSDFMVGPAIGFQGRAMYKGLTFEGLLTQSLLLGRVKRSGTGTRTDDGWEVTGPVVGPFTRIRQVYREERFPFSRPETVALPVTEAKLTLLHDVAKNVSIGAGGFASIWWNAPLAPQGSMPDGIGGRTDWRLRERTLTFLGVTAAVNVRF